MRKLFRMSLLLVIPALVQAQPTPNQLGIRRWYAANKTGIDTPLANASSAVAFDGAYLWIAHYVPSGTKLTKVRVSDGEKTEYTDGFGSYPVAIAFDGKNLWTANAYSDNVTKFDPSTGITSNFPVGTEPRGIEFDGRYVWVANIRAKDYQSLGGSSSVIKLDPITGSVVHEFRVGTGPRNVAFDGRYIWVASFDDGSVTRIDANDDDDNHVLTTPSGSAPGAHGVAFDGEFMWATSWTSAKVMKLDRTTGNVLASYDVGGYPSWITFDGTYIWVSNSSSGTVAQLKVKNVDPVQVVGTYPVGTWPYGSAFDGANLWVVKAGGVGAGNPGSLSKL